MKILIATDAWRPQINGVVRTYENVINHLQEAGHSVSVISPLDFTTVPCPTYSSIRLAVMPGRGVQCRIQDFAPDAIHVATEGPIGHAARTWCIRQKLPFTTSFHTRFPEYIRMRAPVPTALMYSYLRRFHGRAVRTLVPSFSQQRVLQEKGFSNVVIWPRGVNTDQFMPREELIIDLQKPVFVYTGRVSVEKNIEAFLSLELPGSKLVIGDGPDLNRLKKKYANTCFAGFREGEELARYLASGDVFVFPSLTDTFGIVLLEAMACGLPVAAYPVTGPIDIVQNGVTGVLSDNLCHAALAALKLDPAACVDFARQHSWQVSAEVFSTYLDPLSGPIARFVGTGQRLRNC